MRRIIVITLLFCSFWLLAAGFGTVKLDERTAAAGVQGQEIPGAPASGEVQDRALSRVGPGVTGPAGITATQLPAPGQALHLPSYAAPTANIAAVANAMRYDYKSLSTIVTEPSGVRLTQPVTISIGYFPSGVAGYGRYCQERVTQTYAPSTGNTFLCALPEGDGQPRRLHVDVTLSEPKPGGGLYNYNVPIDISLDPLYDVRISPLIFTLIMGCSNIGANQIDLSWFSPDNSATPQKVHFATKERETFSIREFSWARSEVSAAANLHPVMVWYEETGFHLIPGFAPLPVPGGTLVPGKTYRSPQGLVSSTGKLMTAKPLLITP